MAWPPCVVMGNVIPDDPFEVAAAEDERPVQAFTPHGADPSFGEGVRPRSPDRGEDDLDAVTGKDRIEAPRVPGVPVPNEEMKRSTPGELPGEVPGLLRDPAGAELRPRGAGWVRPGWGREARALSCERKLPAQDEPWA